jgi:hypothetical protein
MTPAELELKGAKEDAIIENAVAILTQSLSEERSMADRIRTNTPDMVIQLWPEIEASVTASEEEDHW